MDPPYDKGLVDTTLKKINRLDILEEEGLVLIEHSPREVPIVLDGLKVVDERKYGQTLVTFLKQ